MPSDEVRPCPVCGGSGEIHGEQVNPPATTSKKTDYEAIIEKMLDKVRKENGLEEQESWQKKLQPPHKVVRKEGDRGYLPSAPFKLYDHLKDGYDLVGQFPDLAQARRQAAVLRQSFPLLNPVLLDHYGVRVELAEE